MPELTLDAVGGGRINLGGTGAWKVVVVYRGKHCPLCKPYLRTLEEARGALEDAGIEVMAVSADPKEKAEADIAEHQWRFAVGYDLAPDDMRRLGLYISNPRSTQETDRPFAEPGLFVVRPDGRVQIVDISNAPFARPPLAPLPGYIAWIRDNDYPVRGTAE